MYDFWFVLYKLKVKYERWKASAELCVFLCYFLFLFVKATTYKHKENRNRSSSPQSQTCTRYTIRTYCHITHHRGLLRLLCQREKFVSLKLSQAGEPVVCHKNRETEVPLSIRAGRKKTFTGMMWLYYKVTLFQTSYSGMRSGIKSQYCKIYK